MIARYFQQFFLNLVHGLTAFVGYAELAVPVLGSIVAQGMTYTAKALGTAGNGITVTLTTGGTAGAEVVTVVGKAISVQIQSGVTTQTQLKTAIDGSVAAAALVSVAVASGGTAVNAAAAVTTAGGVDGVSTSRIPGGTIARTGVGEFTLTLDSAYPELMSVACQYQAATAVDRVPQVSAQTMSTDGKIVIRLLAGATATDVVAVGRLYVSAFVRKSSVVN